MQKYMTVPMAEISKRAYDIAHKSGTVIAERPCGFVCEQDRVRRMYVHDEGVYYSGVLLPWEDIENFKSFEFHGVETTIKAKFESVQKFLSVRDLMKTES